MRDKNYASSGKKMGRICFLGGGRLDGFCSLSEKGGRRNEIPLKELWRLGKERKPQKEGCQNAQEKAKGVLPSCIKKS